MFCPGILRIWLLLLLGGFSVIGLQHVSGVEIYTPGEVEVINGTDVRLKCTFSSTAPVSQQSVAVSWNFRPLLPGVDESVFYYNKDPYPPDQGRFKGRVIWSGDILRNDASITLRDVLPSFNGTYICQVRNLPDVHGSNGEITLKVVEKVTMSEISILAIAVGAGIMIILILLGVILAVKIYKKKSSNTNIEMHSPENKRKFPAVL